MLCKCHWIVIYALHVTAFSLEGRGVFSDTVYIPGNKRDLLVSERLVLKDSLLQAVYILNLQLLDD